MGRCGVIALHPEAIELRWRCHPRIGSFRLCPWPAFAPALGEPANAWLLVAIGAALMGYAVFAILRLAAKAARGR